MTPAKQLRKAIESCELPHPQFLQQFNPLRQRIEDALDGAASRIERVVGPSRVGKSMLINALKRTFPETKINGRRHVPVLVVPVPTPVSPLLLPSSVLAALGLPVQRNITKGAMDTRMLDQLNLAGTRAVLFEEASHLVELGARVPPRSAGDWFKTLADSHNLTVILFGVPRLQRLFDSNEQLRLRSSAARHLLPYDSRIPEDMKAFYHCVATYANRFRDRGYPIDLPAPALTFQCYLLTGGLIGVLSRFMQELASQLAYDAPRTVTFADCQAAANAIEAAGSRHFPAFGSAEALHAEVAPAALHQAFVQVMNDNDLPVPVIREQAGGVA
ncbi:ATP-binding protein [Cupriavidus sp. WKF15]|uniref:ATP-binding protein n=1 Tax=Cupriavidus sp. WKF15 TaxID=3032282 RepID=UPI0023E2750E|nr:ATP-binding protein [Cupriavidus sp. WKF15]WER46027.1 ATP-binding protein [Cupriavidus sp. WKF15]